MTVSFESGAFCGTPRRIFPRMRNRMKTEGKRLSELLKAAGLKLPKEAKDPIVTSLAIDSRRATPGCMFFALEGMRKDGNSFIDEAISRGAVAVVTRSPRRLGNPKCVFIATDETRRSLAKVARAFNDFPDEGMRLVGVTGTNGKTTVSYLLRHLLSDENRPAGCLGTIGYDLVGRALPSFRTTPESHDLCGLLSQMRQFDCDQAVMEVSSHGIDQLRVAELNFDAALFLNLTRDHLDYHGDMESYFQVKRRLFLGEIAPLPRHVIINLNDPYGERLLEDMGKREGIVSYGTDSRATVFASEIRLGSGGSEFTLNADGEQVLVRSPLIGAYNVENLLAAFATCYALGENLSTCNERLNTFDGIPGRMERVVKEQPFEVVVDYAHTADALQNALSMLREITRGELKVVFGCGGDRDRGKRSEMMKIANELADHCWATSDNPRSEPQDAIFEDMRKGLIDETKVDFIPDRRRAIELAFKSSGAQDCVLVAGKGHEPFQEFGDTVLPFDDRKVSAELLELMSLGGRF